MNDTLSINTWTEHALKQLTEAKEVCDDANNYINLSTTKLAFRDNQLPKLRFYMDAIKQQLRLLGIIKDSLKLNLSGVISRKEGMKKDIKNQLKTLDAKIEEMKIIKVDSSFDVNKPPLIYYISEKDVKLLLENVDLALKEMDDLTKSSRVDALMIRLGSDLDNLDNEFKALEAHFPTARGKKEQQDSISRLLKIDKELELDMVSILKSFNNHYDQCVKGSSMLSEDGMSQDEKDELYRVLQEDTEELPQAMSCLKNDRDNLVMNCKELVKNVDLFHNYFEHVEKFIQSLRIFGEHRLIEQLNDFQTIEQHIQNKLAEINKLKGTISNYIDDFSGFVAAYYTLILEMQRRSETETKIENIIDNFKQNLSAIIREDSEKKAMFLKAHGDFLPENLVSAKIINSSPLKIEINLKGQRDPTPNPTRESVNEALRKLSLSNDQLNVD